MNNYADRGGCYHPPRLKAEVDNIPRYLHNSSHHLKVEFNNCFIIHSRVINKLTDCTSIYIGLFLDAVSGYKQMFFLADTSEEVDDIH